ncbi:DUF5753 domain-containing protein [Micromonospora sp. DT53]|uniref:DUF5753 domain-containing protein n=1 Tax=Micromonospora sp. DT53 TaxID=3393444 RepID=UPI003CF9B81F
MASAHHLDVPRALRRDPPFEFGAAEGPGRFLVDEDGADDGTLRALELAAEAVSLRWFELTVLPGLLQTEAYARAVLSGAGLIPRGELDRHLTVRLGRQGVLKRDDPPQFTAVLDEAVIRRPVGGRATMRDQLLAVAAACAEPHIRVHVVPSTVGAYAGLNGPFVIAHSHDHRVAGYLDNQLQGQVASDPEDIAAMMAAWENVRGEALSHWQSVELITEVAESWS